MMPFVGCHHDSKRPLILNLHLSYVHSQPKARSTPCTPMCVHPGGGGGNIKEGDLHGSKVPVVT